MALVLTLALTLALGGCAAAGSSAQAPDTKGQTEAPSTSDPAAQDSPAAPALPSSPAPAAELAAVVKAGSSAPDFAYSTVEGASGSLAELKGKVVLLNLWASWCGPCVREMPDIAALKAAYPELEVLAVNVSDDPTDARNFIQEAGYDFKWILDEQDSIGVLYPSDAIPYTIIIDKEGVVGATFLGTPADTYVTYETALRQAGLT